MGKNKRRTISVYDSVHSVQLECDSVEEVDFIQWCIEAVGQNILKDFRYQPDSFKLSDSISYLTVDGKSRCLFREHVYSPDFILTFEPNKYLALAKEFKVTLQQLQNNTIDVYIDVKGTFAKSDGGRSFSINQKWTYDKHGIYVYKLVPKDFFKLFGVPEACRLTAKTKKPRKMYLGYKNISQCLLNT